MRWASFILGLLALLTFWFPLLAIPAAIAALITGLIAIKGGRAKRLAGDSDAPAIIGIICAGLGLIPSCIIIIILIFAAAVGSQFEALPTPPPSSDYTRM